MATLDDLRHAILPGARMLEGGDGAPRELAWVRVMKARVPAFDALEAGDVAIVPASALAVVASGPAELDALVDACAGARVGGLILVDVDEEVAGRTQLDALEAAVRGRGLATVRVERSDPGQLERSVIGYLVNRGAELERQAILLEERLESLALAGADLNGLLGTIGGFLGRAVALEGPRGEALAVHASPGVADAGAAVAAYHARPRAGALRVVLPGAAAGSAGGAAGGDAAGSLVLLGERPPSELERVVTGRIAGLLALELARAEAVRRARDTVRRAEPLPSSGPPWVVLVARQRGPGIDDGVEVRDRLRRDLRLLASARRMGLRGDAQSLELRAVLAADQADPDALGLAARIGAFLGRTVAVSRTFDEPEDRPAAEADARATLEAVELLPEPPPVASADRLPAYRMLGHLHNLPDGPRLARALLEPLLTGRADVRREHLATLRAVLDQPGLAEAAAALGVHRNTVAYRVRRIEALTGWRLADPELRLPLSVALRLVQTEQVGTT